MAKTSVSKPEKAACMAEKGDAMQSEDYERKLDPIKEEMREFGCSELAIQKLAWKILEIQLHPGGFQQGLIEDSPRFAEQLCKGKFRRH